MAHPARNAAPPPSPDTPGETPATPDLRDYETLRRLVLGPDQAETLDRITAAGPDGLDAAGVADLLPDAVRLREGRDDALGVALSGTIEHGLKTSVERNPQPVIDAIFPVIGPAIRRAIQVALASSMQSINQSVNYGLSWRGLLWRIEARRQGLSFGEVVLRHTLAYRVEQVLLVHRPGGLLLHHAVAPEVGPGHNPDLVSAMLTAIGQFVEESFQVDDEALDAIQVGDLTVWVEPGPRAVLAAVIRGHPPQELRVALRRALEEVHQRYGRALDAFNGATGPFDGAREVLEPCLDAQYAEPPREGVSPKLWAALALALLALGWWGWTSWQQRAQERAYLRALDAAPGIEVLREDRRDGRLHLVGVRDPLSADPDSIRRAAGLDSSRATARWIPFDSDEPAMVEARFRAAVALPPGVRVRATWDGTLRAEGEADTLWAAAARRALPQIAYARALDVTGVASPLDRLAARIARQTVRFGDAGTAAPAQDLAALRADVRALAAAAARAPAGTVALDIVGHTDSTGTDASNEALSLRRAAAVRDLLAPDLGALPARLVARGAQDALGPGESAESRRVTFRVRRPTTDARP
jgi:OOP family OmpA-OmpF porin